MPYNNPTSDALRNQKTSIPGRPSSDLGAQTSQEFKDQMTAYLEENPQEGYEPRERRRDFPFPTNPRDKAIRFLTQVQLNAGKIPWSEEYAAQGYQRHGAAAPAGGMLDVEGGDVLARPDLQRAPENLNQLPTMPGAHQVQFTPRTVSGPRPRSKEDMFSPEGQFLTQVQLNAGGIPWDQRYAEAGFKRHAAANPGVGVGNSPIANELRNLYGTRTI